MFQKLRNRFVLVNLATTSVVLVIAFSAIYLTAQSSANHRPVPSQTRINFGGTTIEYQHAFDDALAERVRADRASTLRALLGSLIGTGLIVEFLVLLISLYLANQSIKPVKESYDAQKAFIANASHEIKTPLAVIQANLEAADIRDNPWLDNVATKVEDLTALNHQLLTLARLESGHTATKELVTIDLPEYLRDFLAPLRPQLDQKGIKLTLKVTDPHSDQLTLPESDLKQILGILCDNAIKYGRKKIQITVSGRSLHITNDGVRIRPADLPHIFERFYQTDKTKPGVGLGLAIAQQIATSNHWKLTAESDKTTTFTLTF